MNYNIIIILNDIYCRESVTFTNESKEVILYIFTLFIYLYSTFNNNTELTVQSNN